MYESFYGLSSKPFQLNPDPTFYYASRQHRRASSYLEYGMHQNEGFLVITGEVGAGKTTIVRGLLDHLDANKVLAAHLVSTQLDAEDTLRLVGAAFGVRTRGESKADLLMSLEAFMIQAMQQGKRCLLVVDEAQNLTHKSVEELRMLSNFQFGNHALLQTFLIGQPEFRDILQSAEMLQLRQRVIATCHINPLDLQETQGYIEHRLKCAGAKGSPTIDEGAYEAILQASGGIPRRINTLCDRLLLLGFLTNKRDFSILDVQEVIREMEEESESPRASRPQKQVVRTLAVDADDSLLEGIDPGFDLDPQTADEASALIDALNAGQLGERLLRMERSMLRLERLNSATLSLLKQLVLAARRQQTD